MLTIGIVGLLVLAGLVGAFYVMRNGLGAQKVVVMFPPPAQRPQIDQEETVYLPKQSFRLIEKE